MYKVLVLRTHVDVGGNLRWLSIACIKFKWTVCLFFPLVNQYKRVQCVLWILLGCPVCAVHMLFKGHGFPIDLNEWRSTEVHKQYKFTSDLLSPNDRSISRINYSNIRGRVKRINERNIYNGMGEPNVSIYLFSIVGPQNVHWFVTQFDCKIVKSEEAAVMAGDGWEPEVTFSNNNNTKKKHNNNRMVHISNVCNNTLIIPSKHLYCYK